MDAINLSTQIRKSYTYLILFYDSSFYYGVRLCPKGMTPWQDTEYTGSPITHRDKWNKVKFIKFILEVFDDYEKAQEKEKELIRPNLDNKLCLNENLGGIMSIESKIKGAKISGKIQGRKNVESGHLSSISSKGGKVSGKIQGRKNVESGHLSSVSTFESRSKGGKMSSSQRWKCLITGHISTASGLSSYQKARGIDTKLRERIL